MRDRKKAPMAGISEEPEEPEKIKLMIAVNRTNADSLGGYAYSSGEAFEWTLQKIIRDNASDFELVFIHVQAPKASFRQCFPCFRSRTPRRFETPDFVPLPNEPPENTERLRFLDNMKACCRVQGIAFEECIRIGDPKKIICAEVRNVKPDLLIVGNRGLTAFQMFFRAHVSEYCEKHAECPVVRIKRKAATTESLANPCDD